MNWGCLRVIVRAHAYLRYEVSLQIDRLRRWRRRAGQSVKRHDSHVSESEYIAETCALHCCLACDCHLAVVP
jgi:hypothetical protein